jgi:hypothetical protein
MKCINIDTSILDYTKPVSHYCSIYGLSYNAMINRFKRLGVYDKFAFTGSTKTSVIKKNLNEKLYYKSPKKCMECRKTILYEKKENDFCCISCSAKYSNRYRDHSYVTDEFRELARQRTLKLQSEGKCLTPKKIRIKKICPICKKSFEVVPCYSFRTFCSKSCGNKMDRTGISGGYRPNSGRGKMGWYKGYYCQSSWELAWVIYSLDHEIKFERNTKGFEYIFEEVAHKYYPDFLLSDNRTYVEVKGYDSPQWKAKQKQFPHDLQIFTKKKMKPILDYVEQKYGKDYIKLYE